MPTATWRITEDRYGEVHGADSMSGITVCALVDLLNGKVCHRIHQCLAHLPHELLPAANRSAHILSTPSVAPLAPLPSVIRIRDS